MEGLTTKKNVRMKQSNIPLSNKTICSLPEDLTIGVFQNIPSAMLTKTTAIKPKHAITINTMAHTSDGSRNSSSIL